MYRAFFHPDGEKAADSVRCQADAEHGCQQLGRLKGMDDDQDDGNGHRISGVMLEHLPRMAAGVRGSFPAPSASSSPIAVQSAAIRADAARVQQYSSYSLGVQDTKGAA